MKGRHVIHAMALALLAIGFTAASQAADDEATYVGAQKCKMCHIKQHKAWAETKHAKAFENLKVAPKANEAMAVALKIDIKDGAEKTDGCVTCHVTGFKKAGGFPQEDAAKHAAVALVGCESCHGAGSKHVAAPAADKKKTIAKGTAETCKGCHTSDTSPKFSFDEAKAKVHPIAAATPAPAK
jgi:hypothetical protein